MQPACRVATLAKKFHSKINIRLGTKVADATSILSLLLLCATLSSSLEIEVMGADEDTAIREIETLFSDSGGEEGNADFFILEDSNQDSQNDNEDKQS